MRLYEHEGKTFFAKDKIPVSQGKVVTTVNDAVAAANAIGYPVVIKAQVLTGGRGKAGGVKVAKSEAEARATRRTFSPSPSRAIPSKNC